MTFTATDVAKPALPDTTHTGRVRLRVADLDRALAFYSDILGYAATLIGPRSVSLSTAAGLPAHFILEESPGVQPKPWKTAGLFHTAIRVPTRRDLATVISRLLRHDWPIPGMADHGVSEAFYLNDPDENGLEIYRDRPRADWPTADGTLAMVSDPLDMKALFALLENGDVDITTLAPQTDIGHVHLQVSDLIRAEEFYSGILGFDVMQRSYRGALFVSAGGYHHHVGLNVWAGRGVPGLRDDVSGLIDFNVLLPDPASLEEIEARIKRAGITTEHALDATGSPTVHVRDPDGIGVVLSVETVE